MSGQDTENKEKKIATKPEDFKPSLAQLAFAEEFIKSFGNITKAMKAIGYPSRNVYYRKGGWYTDKNFQTWLQEYAQTKVLQHYGLWFLVCEREALNGSYRHMELLMTIAGKFHPRGINIKNALINQVKDGNIIVGNATKEFLSAIAQATGNPITDVGKTEE